MSRDKTGPIRATFGVHIPGDRLRLIKTEMLLVEPTLEPSEDSAEASLGTQLRRAASEDELDPRSEEEALAWLQTSWGELGLELLPEELRDALMLVVVGRMWHETSNTHDGTHHDEGFELERVELLLSRTQPVLVDLLRRGPDVLSQVLSTVQRAADHVERSDTLARTLFEERERFRGALAEIVAASLGWPGALEFTDSVQLATDALRHGVELGQPTPGWPTERAAKALGE